MGKKRSERPKMLSVRISNEQWDALVACAAKKQTNVSEMLRPQLDQLIEASTKQKAA